MFSSIYIGIWKFCCSIYLVAEDNRLLPTSASHLMAKLWGV